MVIIVGILASIAVPRYTRARERAMDKQAQTILSLIRAAERVHYMETSEYFPCAGCGQVSDVNAINSNLSLDIVDDGNWGIAIGDSQGFNATLTRNRGGYNRSWTINSTDINATCSGNCP